MAIILGIVGVILLFALIGAMINFIKWLFKVALVLVVIVGGMALVIFLIGVLGVWTIPILGVIGIIWLLVRLFGPEALAVTVKKTFYDCEMATYGELMAKLSAVRSVDREELVKVLSKYLQEGKLEEIDFPNKGTLYRWTEDRVYPNGVQTKHLRID